MSENLSEDDVDIFLYWKIVNKRKKLFLVSFFSILLISIVYNLFSVKIYRAEFVINMATGRFIDEARNINEGEKNKLKKVFPTTHSILNYIELHPVSDTVFFKDALPYKFKVTIDTKDTAKIKVILSELTNYIDSFPFYKHSVRQKYERFQEEYANLSQLKTLAVEFDRYDTLFSSTSHISLVINPMEEALNLKRRKIELEQLLKNYVSTEIITEIYFSNPQKPNIKSNISLSAIIGLCLGILLVFLAEFRDKIISKR